MVEMKLELYFESAFKIFLQENVKPELSDFQVLLVAYFKIMFIFLLLLLLLFWYKKRQKNSNFQIVYIISKNNSVFVQ
jgi:hypothetical protein